MSAPPVEHQPLVTPGQVSWTDSARMARIAAREFGFRRSKVLVHLWPLLWPLQMIEVGQPGRRVHRGDRVWFMAKWPKDATDGLIRVGAPPLAVGEATNRYAFYAGWVLTLGPFAVLVTVALLTLINQEATPWWVSFCFVVLLLPMAYLWARLRGAKLVSLIIDGGRPGASEPRARRRRTAKFHQLTRGVHRVLVTVVPMAGRVSPGRRRRVLARLHARVGRREFYASAGTGMKARATELERDRLMVVQATALTKDRALQAGACTALIAPARGWWADVGVVVLLEPANWSLAMYYIEELGAVRDEGCVRLLRIDGRPLAG